MSDRDEHPGDLLSALLDGELSTHEADQVTAHVRECAACAAELAEVREAREMLRGLPSIDAPSWLETVGDRRWSSRRPLQVLAGVAAVVVAAALALGGLGSATSVSPDLDVAVADHASTVAALDITRGGPRFDPDVTPTTAPVNDLSSLDPPLRRFPDELGEFRLVEAYDTDDGLQLLYRRGEETLSVFEEPGRIDWDALPAGQGTRVQIGDRDGWRWDDPTADGRVIVYEEDGLVVTVVADEPGDVALDIAELLPAAKRRSATQRIDETITRAVKQLSPA